MGASNAKNSLAGLRALSRVALRIAALVGALCLTAAGEPAFLLREQAWTAPGETLAREMTYAPRECVLGRTQNIEVGRALFRAPALLGGPAARAGLSCNACHSNGRVNARFLLPELTDRPGAADVTSEWSSHLRGDGVVNPVPIPDLVDVGARLSFGGRSEPSLEDFVRGVIVEEFQGQEPSAQAFIGVIAYLRALNSDACSTTQVTITLADAADDVRRALTASRSADAPTARLLLLAAQDAMGRIVERLPARRFARERRGLELLSRELGALRSAGDVAVALEVSLPGWRARFDAVAHRLARRERLTYFNEATLEAALQR